MAKPKEPPGDPMTLGVARLIAYCLNDACRHAVGRTPQQ
jgi:hypothetical protein